MVASIKPVVPGERLNRTQAAPDRFYYVGTLTSLVGEAFDLPPFLILGMPDWASERWEVSARAEGPRSREQMRPLLRALLEDRSALQVHYERRELPVYELVFARADRQLGRGFGPANGQCDPFTNGQRRMIEAPRDRNAIPDCLETALSFAEAQSCGFTITECSSSRTY